MPEDLLAFDADHMLVVLLIKIVDICRSAQFGHRQIRVVDRDICCPRCTSHGTVVGVGGIVGISGRIVGWIGIVVLNIVVIVATRNVIQVD